MSNELGTRWTSQKQYFSDLALSVRPVLKMDQKLGLWDREEGKPGRSWGNVTEHRLVVTARSLVLAKKLGLPEEVYQSVKTGAMLHDVSKKQEKAIVKELDTTNWKHTEEVEAKVANQLREVGFDERAIRLSGAMGHLSIVETEKILDKTKLAPEDLAWLAIHYVDGTTRNADWYDGENDLEKRIEKGKIDKSIKQV